MHIQAYTNEGLGINQMCFLWILSSIRCNQDLKKKKIFCRPKIEIEFYLFEVSF